MKVKLAIIAGSVILLLICAAVGWYMYNKPHQGVADIKADISLVPLQLGRCKI